MVKIGDNITRPMLRLGEAPSPTCQKERRMRCEAMSIMEILEQLPYAISKKVRKIKLLQGSSHFNKIYFEREAICK